MGGSLTTAVRGTKKAKTKLSHGLYNDSDFDDYESDEEREHGDEEREYDDCNFEDEDEEYSNDDFDENEEEEDRKSKKKGSRSKADDDDDDDSYASYECEFEDETKHDNIDNNKTTTHCDDDYEDFVVDDDEVDVFDDRDADDTIPVPKRLTLHSRNDSRAKYATASTVEPCFRLVGAQVMLPKHAEARGTIVLKAPGKIGAAWKIVGTIQSAEAKPRAASAPGKRSKSLVAAKKKTLVSSQTCKDQNTKY